LVRRRLNGDAPPAQLWR